MEDRTAGIVMCVCSSCPFSIVSLLRYVFLSDLTPLQTCSIS